MKNAKIIKAALSMLLIACIMLGVCSLSAFAEDATEAASSETISIVVATKDLAHGTKITNASVTLKEVKNVNIPSNVITDTSEVVGRYVDGYIYEGEYIYKEKTSKSKKVEDNSSILLQSVDSMNKDSYLNIGDYIPTNSGVDVTTIIQKIIDKFSPI